MIAKVIVFCCLFGFSVGDFTCNSGWTLFGTSCYLFVDENVPWTAAEVICRTMGGRIVEVESKAENDFLVQEMHDNQGIQNVWLGLTDFITEGTWQSVSNKEVPEYTNWGPGEPDNLSPTENGQDCAYILPSGVWDDEACFYTVVKHSVGCEMEATGDDVIG